MDMRQRTIGLAIIHVIVVSGIILYTAFADETKASATPAVEIPQTTAATQNTAPTTSTVTVSPTITPEKVSAEALTCTNVTSGEYKVDIRLTNPGTEPRTVDIPGRTVMLSPGQIKRVDILLANEDMTLKIPVDDGTQLLIQSPPCINRGGSGDSASGLETEQLPSPVSPAPEISTLFLMSTGIIGLLLVSRRRKD